MERSYLIGLIELVAENFRINSETKTDRRGTIAFPSPVSYSRFEQLLLAVESQKPGSAPHNLSDQSRKINLAEVFLAIASLGEVGGITRGSVDKELKGLVARAETRGSVVLFSPQDPIQNRWW